MLVLEMAMLWKVYCSGRLEASQPLPSHSPLPNSLCHWKRGEAISASHDKKEDHHKAAAPAGGAY